MKIKTPELVLGVSWKRTIKDSTPDFDDINLAMRGLSEEKLPMESLLRFAFSCFLDARLIRAWMKPWLHLNITKPLSVLSAVYQLTSSHQPQIFVPSFYVKTHAGSGSRSKGRSRSYENGGESKLHVVYLIELICCDEEGMEASAWCSNLLCCFRRIHSTYSVGA